MCAIYKFRSKWSIIIQSVSSNRMIPNAVEISEIGIPYLVLFCSTVWSMVRTMKEEILSTLSGNAKLERVAISLDHSCVSGKKKNHSRWELWAETNKMKIYWVIVNSCLLHIYRIGKFMAKFLWFYLTTCSIWANMVLTDA